MQQFLAIWFPRFPCVLVLQVLLTLIHILPSGGALSPPSQCQVSLPEGWEQPCPECDLTPKRRAHHAGHSDPAFPDPSPPGALSLLTRPRADRWGSGIGGLASPARNEVTGEARFKAAVLNAFVLANQIGHVVEIGYSYGGDVYQDLTKYPKYTGYDSNNYAWKLFYSRHAHDPSKQFKLYYDYSANQQLDKGDLALSLEVIHHMSDFEMEDHLRTVFSSSSKYVILYAHNKELSAGPLQTGRHRRFTEWVEKELGETWAPIASLTNRFPAQAKSDFFFFKSRAWDHKCGAASETPKTFKWWSMHPGSSLYGSPSHQHFRHGSPTSRFSRPAAGSVRPRIRRPAIARSSVETAARNMGSYPYGGKVLSRNG